MPLICPANEKIQVAKSYLLIKVAEVKVAEKSWYVPHFKWWNLYSDYTEAAEK